MVLFFGSSDALGARFRRSCESRRKFTEAQDGAVDLLYGPVFHARISETNSTQRGRDSGKFVRVGGEGCSFAKSPLTIVIYYLILEDDV